MRGIRSLVAALLLAASNAVAEDSTYSGSLFPAVGSPCGYLKLVDESIPRDAQVRLVESSSADGARASIPQRVARRGPMRGELVVALRGLAVNTTYDVVILRPGRRPLVAASAYRTEHPTVLGGLNYLSDGRAGPGQHLMIWHDSSGRRVQVEVGGVRARIVEGPWDLTDGHGFVLDTGTTFVLPKLAPGPAEVVISDECGWSAPAGTIEVLANRREITFRAAARRFRTEFQEARGGTDWFRIDTTSGTVPPAAGFWFTLKSDVRTATLPATYTQSTEGASLEIAWSNFGRRSPRWEAGEWTLTVEEIAEGEVRGTFSARLVDTREPHRERSVTDGRFRLPFTIYEGPRGPD